MRKEDLRIVYMGTPDFAVEPLKALVDGGYNVVGVITMPDKHSGRGMKLQYSPVKQYALEASIPLLQPEKLKNPEFIEELRSLQADLQIVVAFRMLPEVVWNMPKLGTFNLHASLLPQYRGAAPINWAIINGDKESGITTFFLTHEIDTGDVIQQERVAISTEDTAGDLHDTLMTLGSKLVVETVDNIIEGNLTPIPQDKLIAQDPNELRAAPKIFKETCRIDWNKPVESVYNHVRGLSPYPAAWSEIQFPSGDTQMIKIYQSTIERVEVTEPVGTLITDGKRVLKVALADGYLHLDSVQLAGKKRVPAGDFIRGFRFEEGLCLK